MFENAPSCKKSCQATGLIGSLIAISLNVLIVQLASILHINVLSFRHFSEVLRISNSLEHCVRYVL